MYTNSLAVKRFYPGLLFVFSLLCVPLADGADSVVVVNEVHYHPTGDQVEWLELRSLMGVRVDLSGWAFVDGIRYEFPEGTILEGHGYLVLTADMTHPSLAGVANKMGNFEGKLDNSGERLTLVNRNGRVMESLRYRDEGRWPEEPDGWGVTLARLDEGSAHGGASNWTFSREIGGTPGEPNFPGGSPGETLVINEMSPGGDRAFRIELQNIGSSPINLDGYEVRVLDDLTNSVHIYSLQAETVLPGGFVVVTNADLRLHPSAGDRIAVFAPGGTVLTDARVVADELRGRGEGEWAGEWLYPVAPTFGAPNDFGLTDAIVINEILYHREPTYARAGEPGAFSDLALLEWDASWRYNESGQDLGSGWAGAAHPIGGNWKSGAGILGFETTQPPVPIGTELSDPATLSTITYYFETEFTLTEAQLAAAGGLLLEHLIDDGAVVYLNGTEVFRYNLPAGSINASTLASSVDNAATIGPVELSAASLVPGQNRISVEVHQTNATSSDILMGLRLYARIETEPGMPDLPYAESDEQWIELYNRGASTVDLSGWVFDEGVEFFFPAGTTLEPGQYLVLTKDAAALSARLGGGVAVYGDYSGNLARSGERLRLADARGNPADEVRYYDKGIWHSLADGGGSSLELLDPDADNRQASAWRASDETHRGAWKTYTYEGKATKGLSSDPTQWNEFVFGMIDDAVVLIDDISVIEDPNGTARELIQNGDFESGTADKWRILGNHRRFSVIDDPDQPGNKVLRVVAEGTTDTMHNHAETTLKHGGTWPVIDANKTYRISFRARWAGGSPQLHTRLYFNRLARTTILDINGHPGTPGAPNTGSVANTGPTYRDLIHEPAVPQAGEPAVISVRPHDPDGIDSLSLFYSVDGGNFQSVPMSGDGDGLFSGTIPGQPAGAKALFYIEGEDGLGATTTAPSNGPEARALIPWDDGLAQLVKGSVHPNNIRIVMTDADANWMHQSINVMNNAMLPCTVIYNEERIYYNAGVRIKGSARGRDVDSRVSFRLKFDASDLFLGVHRDIAIDRSGPHDTTSVREILVKQAMNHAGGIPITQDDLIHVIAPLGGIHTSEAMLNKSRYDKEFLDAQFEDGSEGEIFEYEIIYAPTDTLSDPSLDPREQYKKANTSNLTGVPVQSLGPDKENYRAHWQIKNKRSRDRHDHLIEWTSAMGQSAGPVFHEEVEALTDMDGWLRTVAMHVLFGVSDSYVGSSFAIGLRHNMAVYFRSSDDKAIFLPWDMDFAMDLSATLPIANHNHLGDDLDKLLTDPAKKRLYYGHLHDILQTTFNPAYMNDWTAHFSEFTSQNLSTMHNGYISTRSAHVASLIQADLPRVDFAVDNPSATTNEATVEITGRGWIDVREIRVSGVESALPVEWTGESHWRVRVPVPPGTSTVALEAYDFQGASLGSDSVQVTSTFTVFPAGPGDLVISEIMYHPALPTAAEIAAGFNEDNDFEFIEFYNISGQTLDLSGLTLGAGVSFDFGTAGSSILAPGGRVLVVEDEDAFHFRYGTRNGVLGKWSGKLDNAGERLTLVSSSQGTVLDFTYSDDPPWPAEADGDGHSLVLVAPETNPPHSSHWYWRAGNPIHGEPLAPKTPGYRDWTHEQFGPVDFLNPAVAGPSADPDSDGVANLLEYALAQGDPLSGNAPLAPRFALAADGGAEAFATLIWQAPVREDLDYRVKISNDLILWFGNGDAGGPYLVETQDSPSDLGDGIFEHRFRETGALPDEERVFILLEVQSRFDID